MITKYLAALAATALVAAPVAAAPATSLSLSANPATSLSLSKSVRAGSATTKKNSLAGTGLLIGIFAAVAVVVGVVVVSDGGDSDSN